MLKKVIGFVKYNNAFPIALSLLLLSTSVSFAASEDLRDSVINSTEVVRSVDNHLIVSVDLDSFDFNLKINDVIEDENGYTVLYSYQTIAIDDYTWKVITLNKTLDVSKKALEDSYLKDLGLYVAKNLGDNLNTELVYLKRVQQIEIAKGMSQKIVTTEYSGLIGKHLDPKDKVFDGYSAVIEPRSREEIADNMSVEEISAKTRQTLLERKKKEQEKRARLAEEKKKQEEANLLLETQASSTNNTVTSSGSSSGEVLGETSSDNNSTTTEETATATESQPSNNTSTTTTEQSPSDNTGTTTPNPTVTTEEPPKETAPAVVEPDPTPTEQTPENNPAP